MTIDDFKLTAEDVPRLKRFRTYCLTCFACCVLGLIVVATVAFAPQAVGNAARLFIVLVIASVYFATIGVRTQVMMVQLAKGRDPMFRRPSPKWITAVFLMCEFAALVLRARQ